MILPLQDLGLINMAQALFNNLNNIKDEISSVKDVLSKGNAEILNFESILDSQTLQENENSHNDTETEQNSAISNLTECLSTVLNEVIGETAIEMATDTINSDITVDVTENEDLIPTNEIEENNTQNITINEDPTLNRELIDTLENSANTTVLQSHIQKFQQVIAENDDTGIISKDSTDTRQENQNLASQIFKNLDSSKESKNSAILTTSVEKNNTDTKTNSSKLNDYINEKVVKDLNIESVDNESTSNQYDSENLMQNQTPQEQVVKAMIHGELKFESVIKVSQTQNGQPSSEITSTKIIEQITKQLDGLCNSSKLNIILNPESLGKIALQIINSKDGLLAQFTVTTQDAMNSLLKGIETLRESLIAQGVSVDNVVVKLNESNDSEQHFDWTEQEGSRGGNKQQGSKQQKEQEKHFEQMMFEINNNDKV